MQIKIKLYEAMAKRDIRTIAEMSRLSGLSRKSISNIINEQTTRLDLNTLYKLCTALNCKVGDLVVMERNDKKA